MNAIGFSLNLVSLLAITLVTGILVDDAIVEIENIVRHMRMGKSAYRASLEAADEIGLAVIAISLSIAAIFAPVSFMGGIAGQYFRQFGLTVAIAVMFSLVVARFVTPVRRRLFPARARWPRNIADGAVMRFYTRLVRGSVRRRWLTLLVGRHDLRRLAVVDAAAALRLHPRRRPRPRAARRRVAAGLAARRHRSGHARDLRQVARDAGGALGAGLRRPDPRRRRRSRARRRFVINFVHKSKREATQKDLQTRIGADSRRPCPTSGSGSSRTTASATFQLIVAGTDIDQINDTANQIASEMRIDPAPSRIPISTAELDRPELQIEPSRQVAADLGVSTEALSDDDPRRDARRHRRQSRQVQRRRPADPDPRRARRSRAQPRAACCRTCACRPASGGDDAARQWSPISRSSHGPTAINRYDRSRRVTIEADLRGDAPLGDAVAAIKALPTAKNLPPGVEIRETGDVEIMSEVFASFAAAMGAGLMMVYGLLVLLFGSFLQPITILVSLPLSIGGSIIALLITHKAMSMPVVIGILMLMGIVTKNAIMLVDFAVEEIAHGHAAAGGAGRGRAASARGRS